MRSPKRPRAAKPLLPILFLLLSAALFSACLNDGGTELPNEVHGTLYNANGTPAANATVALFRVSYLPGNASPDTGKHLAQTGASGKYAFQDVPDGFYNLVASGTGTVAFRDSVLVTGTGTSLPRDTLRAAGTLTATVRLQPQHSPQTATVQVLGTDYYANVSASGRFTLALPRGSHRLRIAVSLEGYTPLFRTVTVRSGANDTLADPLVPFYSGIHTVTGLSAVADSGGRVFLKWNAADYAQIRHYLIYRSAAGSLTEGVLIGTTSDTAFIDTVFAQSYAQAPRAGQYAFSDTIAKSFDYRVSIQSLSNLVGPYYGFSNAVAVPPAITAATSGRWTQVTANAAFPIGGYPSLLAYHDTLWLFWQTAGGTAIWASANGTDWQIKRNNVPEAKSSALAHLPGYAPMRATVLRDTMWVMGESVLLKSVNGINWTASDLFNFPGQSYTIRNNFLFGFKDKFHVVGGGYTYGFDSYGPVNKSFSSANGTVWTGTTHDPFVYGRAFETGMGSGYGKVAFANKLWMIGGGLEVEQTNPELNPAVWSSEDGASWTKVLNQAPFLPRTGHAVTVHDGAMWVVGGRPDGLDSTHIAPPTREVWKSTDGISWSLVDLRAPFGARSNTAAASFKGRLWVIGGAKFHANRSVEQYYNDIWYYE